MHEWVRMWSITITWDRADHSPWETTRYQTHAETPAELRRLVEAARADKHVTSFPYKSIRKMVGEDPAHCPAGHKYEFIRLAGKMVSREWVPCRCGGHIVWLCFAPGCTAARLPDPPVYDDCDADPRRLSGELPPPGWNPAP